MNVSPGSYIQIELGVMGSGVAPSQQFGISSDRLPTPYPYAVPGRRGVAVTILLPQMPVKELPDREDPGGAD